MKLSGKTPEARSTQWLMVQVRTGRLSQERLYEIGSEIAGRKLSPGFGLSTLVLAELVRLCRRVAIEIGEEPGETRRGPRRAPSAGHRAPSGNVTAIASLDALQMIEGLRRDLHLAPEELEGITQRATQGRTARARTARDARVVIEALWSIRNRRAKQAAGAADHGPQTMHHQGGGVS